MSVVDGLVSADSPAMHARPPGHVPTVGSGHDSHARGTQTTDMVRWAGPPEPALGGGSVEGHKAQRSRPTAVPKKSDLVPRQSDNLSINPLMIYP